MGSLKPLKIGVLWERTIETPEAVSNLISYLFTTSSHFKDNTGKCGNMLTLIMTLYLLYFIRACVFLYVFVRFFFFNPKNTFNQTLNKEQYIKVPIHKQGQLCRKLTKYGQEGAMGDE